MLQSPHWPAACRPMGPALAAALAGACGTHPAPSIPGPTAALSPPVRPECLIAGDSSGSEIVPLVARTAEDTVMVRRQWSVPPMRLDCTGQPSAGSAVAWSADTSGLHWTIVLSERAPDAAAVVSAWRHDAEPAGALAQAGVHGLVPLDPRRIVIELDQASSRPPPVLADAALAVPVDSAGPALALASSTGDPRDALEHGAALLRTSDPELIAYARGKNKLRVVPLPWSRSYVLVLPPGGSLPLTAAADSASFRAGLARDVVPGDARAPEPPFWWESPPACGPAPGAALAPRQTGPLLYAAGDSTAAALAARLVALSDDADLTVRGAPAAALDSALARDARGAVVAVPRRALLPCRELGRWPSGSRLVALVETRESAVVAQGVPALAIDYDGTIRPARAP
jgi:hypothetical protein